jgi:hypothetical protein
MLLLNNNQFQHHPSSMSSSEFLPSDLTQHTPAPHCSDLAFIDCAFKELVWTVSNAELFAAIRDLAIARAFGRRAGLEGRGVRLKYTSKKSLRETGAGLTIFPTLCTHCILSSIDQSHTGVTPNFTQSALAFPPSTVPKINASGGPTTGQWKNVSAPLTAVHANLPFSVLHVKYKNAASSTYSCVSAYT